MSLTFGIYLVEQRIISPEQFCGLVKIQQQASRSMASIAIRQNLLTMKQVARVLDIMEVTPDASFIQLALKEQLIDSTDADLMLHLQQSSCPTIRNLVVECGLLTQRQSEVLFAHFEKQNWIRSQEKTSQAEIVSPSETAATEEKTASRIPPRQPKFTQRPAVVQPYTSQIQN